MDDPEKRKYIVEEISIEEEGLDHLEGFEQQSNFESISAWLSEICKNQQHEIKIQEFKIDVLESQNTYVLRLFGVNKYVTGPNSYAIRIDYRPEITFFRLPDKATENLNPDQVRQKIVNELSEFSHSDSFKHSFLTKSDKVTIEFNGQQLWRK